MHCNKLLKIDFSGKSKKVKLPVLHCRPSIQHVVFSYITFVHVHYDFVTHNDCLFYSINTFDSSNKLSAHPDFRP